MLSLLRNALVASVIFSMTACSSGSQSMIAEQSAGNHFIQNEAAFAAEAESITPSTGNSSARPANVSLETSLDITSLRSINRTGLRSRIMSVQQNARRNLVTQQAALDASLQTGVVTTLSQTTNTALTGIVSTTDATLTPLISNTISELRYLPNLIAVIGRRN